MLAVLASCTQATGPVDGQAPFEAAGAGGAAGEGGARAQLEAGAYSEAGANAAAGKLIIRPALFVEEDHPLRVLSDGDPVDISQATQGGQVIYIGALVSDLNAETAYIHTRLIHPDTEKVRAEDQRTIVMTPLDDGSNVFQPDIRSRNQVSHLIICPLEVSEALLGEPWLLEVTLSDVTGQRSATETLTVYPSCENRSADSRPVCESECSR